MSIEEKFLRILKETKEPAYDVETSGLDWKCCYTCGYSVSDGKDAVYVPVRHAGGGNIQNVDAFEHSVSSIISQRGSQKIVGHNIKFDMHFSTNHGIKLNNVSDTMVREALIDETQRSYALENVCTRWPGITPKKGKLLYQHIAETFDCKNDRSAMAHYHKLAGDDPIAVEYAEHDTLCTKQLYDAQAKQLYGQQLDLVASLEDELTAVLFEMERRGVRVDPEVLKSVKTEINEQEEKAGYWAVNEDENGICLPMNVRSNSDLKQYFEACDIDDWPTTAPTTRFPNGQPSFNADFLAASETGLRILNYRRLQHLQNSFLNVIDGFLYKDRIHTTFHQAIGETFHGTRFGRLSCSWPNMQQVPKRDRQLGAIYRSIFTARQDFILCEFDYSQAEPRLFSHYSEEPSLLRGYNSVPFVDMHAIAVQLMGEPLVRIAAKARSTPRDVAKNLNLGIMYTMGPAKLSIKLGIDYDEAMDILNHWQSTFPRASNYNKSNPGFTQKAQRVAEQRGYVKTILGRRARFDNPRFAYRAANRIVQGGSADIMKWKLVEVDRMLKQEGWSDTTVCMLLTIHDSILFEIHKDYVDIVIPKIKEVLERVNCKPFDLKVPFVAEYKTGSNWSEATYGIAA